MSDARPPNGRPKRTLLLSLVGLTLAIGVLLGGWLLQRALSPPGLPRTAEEALRVVGSDRFERLDHERRSQYLAESVRLLARLPDGEKGRMYEDERYKSLFDDLELAMLDDAARSYARGDDPKKMWSDLKKDGDPPPRKKGEPGRGSSGAKGDAAKGSSSDDALERKIEYFTVGIQSGNPQSIGLQIEMYKRMTGGEKEVRERGGN